MNDYLNQLRALMGFYDQNGPHLPTTTGGFGSMFGNSAVMNQYDNARDKMNFALAGLDRMSRLPQNGLPNYGGSPDFFAQFQNAPQYTQFGGGPTNSLFPLMR